MVDNKSKLSCYYIYLVDNSVDTLAHNWHVCLSNTSKHVRQALVILLTLLNKTNQKQSLINFSSKRHLLFQNGLAVSLIRNNVNAVSFNVFIEIKCLILNSLLYVWLEKSSLYFVL